MKLEGWKDGKIFLQGPGEGGGYGERAQKGLGAADLVGSLRKKKANYAFVNKSGS